MRAAGVAALAAWGCVLAAVSAQAPGAWRGAGADGQCIGGRGAEAPALLQVRGLFAKESVLEDLGAGPSQQAAVQRARPAEDGGGGGARGQVAVVPLESERRAQQPRSQAQRGLAVLQAAVWSLETDVTRLAVARKALHGLVLGGIYGLLHIVAPDHLGTLISLGASAECPTRAFAMGAWWGFGHCLGMVAVAGVFLVMGHLAHGVVERWEHYGDYAIGMSMCLLALYFAATESFHFEKRPDGSCALMRCACHPNGGAGGLLLRGKPGKGADGEEDAVGQQARLEWKECPPCSDASAAGAALAAARQAPAQAQGAGGSMLLGMFQGVCCPCGLAGLSFMADLSGVGLVWFAIVFSVVSIAGTGLLAMSWSCLGLLGCGVNISQVWMYRASYCFTFLLGVCWLLAAYYNIVDTLDYTEGISGTTTV